MGDELASASQLHDSGSLCGGEALLLGEPHGDNLGDLGLAKGQGCSVVPCDSRVQGCEVYNVPHDKGLELG